MKDLQSCKTNRQSKHPILKYLKGHNESKASIKNKVKVKP